jgi:hypothetical protein
MRRLLLLAALIFTAAGCGASKHAQTTTTTRSLDPPPFTGAAAKTTKAGTVKFEQVTSVTVSGSNLAAYETGTTSFRLPRRAHVYKQLPGGGTPGEVIVIGPYIYANVNVQAALSDPSVQPWTKLDTRKLNARERANQSDELAHAIAPAFLPEGVQKPHLVGLFGSLWLYRGTVDPTRLSDALPASLRAIVMKAVHADYPAKPFTAKFWLDARGRVRRVLVDYKTPKGSPVEVATQYSAYGTAVDVSLPPARSIKDITPTH